MAKPPQPTLSFVAHGELPTIWVTELSAVEASAGVAVLTFGELRPRAHDRGEIHERVRIALNTGAVDAMIDKLIKLREASMNSALRSVGGQGH